MARGWLPRFGAMEARAAILPSSAARAHELRVGVISIYFGDCASV